MTITKEFRLSYDGEAEYDIRRDHRIIVRVSVRHWGNTRQQYNGDYFERGILPQVGTVRWASSTQYLEFPPDEVVALFPGFVACRLVFHPRTPDLTITHPDYELPEVEYQYNGSAPILVKHPEIPEYITHRTETTSAA